MLPLSSIPHSYLPLPTSRKDGWAREELQLCTLQKEGNLPWNSDFVGLAEYLLHHQKLHLNGAPFSCNLCQASHPPTL